MKRYLKFNYEDCADSKEIGKAVEVEITDESKSFMYVEKMKGGKFRMTWSKGFFLTELGSLKNIEIIREN